MISFEEQFRGWFSLIGQTKDVAGQVVYYSRLTQLNGSFNQWKVLAFDHRAANEFKQLRRSVKRIGTMDLKIASIVLVHNAKLLTANLRDFQQIPNLQLENWLR